MIVFQEKDFIDYTIDSKSEEAALHPVSNIKLYEKQFRAWRTTSTAENWVIFDFGAPKRIEAVVLINTNYTTYKIQGDTTNSFASPPVDSGIITLAQDKFTERYRSKKDPQGFSPVFNHQFMRILIPTQTPTDGAGYFSTGAIIITDQAEAFLRHPSFGFSIEVDQSIQKTQLVGGGIETIEMGEPFVRINFSNKRDRTLAHFEQYRKHFINIGTNKSVVMSFDSQFIEDADSGQYVYILQRMENPSWQISGFDHADTENRLREMI